MQTAKNDFAVCIFLGISCRTSVEGEFQSSMRPMGNLFSSLKRKEVFFAENER